VALVHAAWLLLTVVVTVALVWTRRARDLRAGAWLIRVTLGAAAGLLVFLLPLMVFACSCGAGNNPVRQAAVAAVGAAGAVALIGPRALRVGVAGAMLLSGLALGWHFQHLVLPRGGTPCRFTGDPAFVRNSCSADPARVHVGDTWYTPVTGLHPVSVD